MVSERSERSKEEVGIGVFEFEFSTGITVNGGCGEEGVVEVLDGGGVEGGSGVGRTN